MGHRVEARRQPAASPDEGTAGVPPIVPPSTPDQLGVAQLVVGFGIALAAMVAFALVAINLTDQEAVALDDFAGPFLHSISSPTLDAVMNAITNLGSATVLGVLFVLVEGVLLYRRDRAKALFLAAALGGSVALNGILKVTIERPRPMLPWAHVLPDFSFPSGHSMNSLVFYLAVALIVWVTYGRRIGIVAVAVAVIISISIGFSRIYLGYHYLSDVVGGFLAGLAWLFVVAIAFETIPRTWARRGHSKST